MTITTSLDAPSGSTAPAAASPPASPAPPAGPPPTITSNRRRLDNRFPVLAFNIRTQGRPWFEVLLTTDGSLFDPAAAARRTPSNFYAGRQDGGLMRASAGETAYVVPAVVLKRFADARPRPAEIFYTVAVYETPEGAPLLAQPPAVLSTTAPSVLLGGDFQAHTMAAVLSVPVEKLHPMDAVPDVAPEPPAPQAFGDPALDDSLPVSAATSSSYDYDDDPAADVAAQAWDSDPQAMSLDAAVGAPEDTPLDVPTQAAYSGEPGDEEPLDGAMPDAQAYDEGDRDEDQVDTEYGDVVAGGYDDSFSSEDDVDESYGGPESYGSEAGQYSEADAADIAYDDGYEDAPASGSAWADAAEASFPPDAAEPAQLADVEEDEVDEELVSATDWDESLDAGVYGAYGNGNSEAPAAPSVIPAAPAAPAAGVPLDIPTKIGIVTKLGRKFEAPPAYAAVNADTEFSNPRLPQYQRRHVGLSYGLVQFTQDSGMLGRLLAMMRERDPAKFGEVFGPQSDELVRVTCQRGPSSRSTPGGRSVRVQPVGGADLWQEPWLARFRAAGAHTPFQAAQNELAVRAFLDPMLGFAAAFGLNTERALAMVCDRAIQQGPAGARRWLTAAIGPIRTDAQRQQALGALGLPGLREFQQISGLRPDGKFGPVTHAALVAKLRQLGPASPVPFPTREQSMDAIVMRADAGNASRKARPRAIRFDPEFADVDLVWTNPAAGGRR